eukprot:CAMPEP_0116872600 /NCGR_PEP_ID=MMETSP0463-20121206/3380_1 /TAXON_ID=181622 /ORGANISM="Strombidinopsis sp, Strain SopsisLIS2011" /LENGTH=83 /DNA_ID=CAMNT_0004513043 /DNA_START=494 /DNA_END=745 /DNA_ORIENTATION=-
MVVDKRDYNLINNQYDDCHEEKTLADEDLKRREAALIYWKEREYNPISNQNYDQEQEDKYQEQKAKKIKDHWEWSMQRLPKAV